MKRILILSNMYPSFKGPTFGIFIKNQADQLRKSGMDVDIVAINDPQMNRFSVLKKYGKWFLSFLYNFLRKGRTYDIVHVHYIFPTGIIGLFYKKLLNRPMVVTAHGGDIEKMARKNKFFWKCTQYILKQADHVICVGEHLYNTIINDYNIPSEKLTILNMGVDTNIFQPMNRDNLRKKYKIPPYSKLILFVGNIIKQKGVMELIEAYNTLKSKDNSYNLVLIGAKKVPNFSIELETFIKRNNIKDVSFLNPKSQQEISEWMNIANVFVLPSHMEGLGLVALEAMASNIPVVASKVGGLQYLLADGLGILVTPENANALAEGINIVLSDDAISNKMSSLAYKKALENDSQIIITKLLKIYSSVENIERR